jgi:hypothetical protein
VGGLERWQLRNSDAVARNLIRLALTPSHDGKGSQQNHNSGGAENVRHPGNRTRNVAGVGPDEADDRPHAEHGDAHGQPVQDPASDGAEPTPIEPLLQSRTKLCQEGIDSEPEVHPVAVTALARVGADR